MDQQQQLQQIEISIDQAKEAVALSSALRRLHQNKDFELVITKGFFDAEASRAVLLRADPEMQSDENQKQINDIITSIGGLYGFLSKVYRVGQMAEQSMSDDQETRGEILQEQLGEENIDGS